MNECMMKRGPDIGDVRHARFVESLLSEWWVISCLVQTNFQEENRFHDLPKSQELEFLFRRVSALHCRGPVENPLPH